MSRRARKGGRSGAQYVAGGLGSGARVKQQRRSLVQQGWEELKAVARPLFFYWTFLTLMFGAFSGAAMWDSPGMESVWILVAFALVTFGSIGLGQLMAMLRLRDWMVYVYWVFMWTVGMWFGIFTAAVVGPLAVVIFLWIFCGPMFTLAGVWSLRIGRGIFSAWVPLMYASGTAIIVAENKGKVSQWQAGDKWVVWDVFTFGVLGVGVMLMLAFLVSRETHRLHLWRRAPDAQLRGSVKEKGAARPRLSCFGWVLLCFLAMGLSVGTAVLAPYLWRTGPAEEGDGNGGTGEGEGEGQEQGEGDEPREPREGEGQQGKRKPAETLEEGMQNAKEELEETLPQNPEQGLDLLATLLTMLVLMLLGLLIFWRPVKRLLLVRHCRDPLWSTSPTGRIEQGWRLVEIALADAGVRARPGEPAVSLLRRARPVLDEVASGHREIHGLAEAAEIRDRVAYGLGVGAEDVALMERVSHWAYDTVWDRLGDKGQLKAMYRGL